MNMFLEALEKILGDNCTSAAVRNIESGASPDALWQPIEEAGFLDLLLQEEQGGADLPLTELFSILECLGRFAVPVPLALSIVARAVARAPLPAGPLTLATQTRHAGEAITCQAVPYGATAAHVLVRDGNDVLLLSCASARRELVGDPRNATANLTWDKPAPLLRIPQGGERLSAMAAAATAAQLSGAMQRVFEMTLAHCNTRVQFGKSIGKFQAIQQQVSVMAEHVLAAAIAAEAAFRPHAADPSAAVPSLLTAAVAKSRTSEAASHVAATAHALHGAIGMTDEFDLSILTRRIHEWRIAYGAETYWNRIVGTELLASDVSLAEFVSSW
jgi:acyl-CoA dehydrogenase